MIDFFNGFNKKTKIFSVFLTIANKLLNFMPWNIRKYRAYRINCIAIIIISQQ